MILSFLITFVIFLKTVSTPLNIEVGNDSSYNYIIYIALFVLILASLGINIWLLMICNGLYAGTINIRNIKDNETYNLLQILIPISIGIFLIQFSIILYYLILINYSYIG